MRETFHDELARLAWMSRMVAEAMRLASRARLDADPVLARRVIIADVDLDRCEEHTHALLALQAPVARDLRALRPRSAAGRTERMGDLAAHIAAIVRFSDPSPPNWKMSSPSWVRSQPGWPIGSATFSPTRSSAGFAVLETTDQMVDTPAHAGAAGDHPE